MIFLVAEVELSGYPFSRALFRADEAAPARGALLPLFPPRQRRPD